MKINLNRRDMKRFRHSQRKEVDCGIKQMSNRLKENFAESYYFITWKVP